jgi:molecular chaperone HscC
MLVGIDLGTTHSLVACYGDDGPVLVPNALGEFLTPSVVALDDGMSLLVGQAAKERLVTRPDAAVATFKRWMGTGRLTSLGDKQYRPEQLSALVLRSLLDDVRAHTGQEVTQAVISVPAYFSDAQRKATRTAGEMAGVKVEVLVNEPTAAALAYGLQDTGRESRFLVFDLGGGTLDVSILEMFDGVVEVRSSTGDNWLGGEDFLDVLIKDFETRCLPEGAAGLSALDRAQLRRKLDVAKCTLSSSPEVTLEGVVPGQMTPWHMTQDRFALLCEPLQQRMRTPLERAVRDAKLKPSEIDEIVLVGGASRMPMVVQMVTRMMGRLPLRHVNPDHAIALGAACAAGLRARHQKLKEVVLTDVCPYTLGTEVGRELHNGKIDSGYFHPIITRNQPVPISREDVFYPVTDQQTALALGVYQGESPYVRNNIKLGELSVPIGKVVAGQTRGARVRFTYDVSGILQVEAWDLLTGKRYELVLQQGETAMSPEEIAQRIAALDALKTHPRNQQENQALLARAERVYEEYIYEREDVQRWMAMFKQVLETQDLALVAEHRVALRDRLNHLEGVQ